VRASSAGFVRGTPGSRAARDHDATRRRNDV
jgi:hypothetical protein